MQKKARKGGGVAVALFGFQHLIHISVYNLARLTACLAPLLGFRQPPAGTADTPTLADELLAATGAVAMQEVHPLLTLRNIFLSAPELPADSPGDEPGAQFNAYLDQMRRAAVGKVLQAFAARKKLTGAGQSVLADAKLTGQSGEFARKVVKQGRFVGLALRLTEGARDVAVRITAVGTQLSEPNPDFRLFLFHSSQAEAVATYPLPRLSRVYFEWSPLAITLPGEYEGGEWCLGYFEDDLAGQAVDLQHGFTRRPGTCCGSDYLLFDKWAPYVQVRAFAVDEAAAEPGSWTGVVSYLDSSNFGLNLELAATCDLSSYFCRHAELFLPALQTQLAVDLLTAMANTTRNNGLASDVQALALLALNNRPEGQQGLLGDLKQAIEALDVDLSGISRPCLPCKTNGYRWGAVGG